MARMECHDASQGRTNRTVGPLGPEKTRHIAHDIFASLIFARAGSPRKSIYVHEVSFHIHVDRSTHMDRYIHRWIDTKLVMLEPRGAPHRNTRAHDYQHHLRIQAQCRTLQTCKQVQ
jgi:hypothetical protein